MFIRKGRFAAGLLMFVIGALLITYLALVADRQLSGLQELFVVNDNGKPLGLKPFGFVILLPGLVFGVGGFLLGFSAFSRTKPEGPRPLNGSGCGGCSTLDH